MKTSRYIPITLLALAAAAHAQTAPASPPAPSPRITLPLTTNWQFHAGTFDPDTWNMPAPADYWQPISLPHTWNAADGADGGNNYRRATSRYRTQLTLTPNLAGKQLFLRFDGANRITTAYINGKRLGEHIGGTQAFTFDVTSALAPGQNTLDVTVDNADRIYAPLNADFTFWGGIYRPVELIAVDPFHISLTDFSSPGVYITTPEITDAQATVHARIVVKNDGAQPDTKNVTAEISSLGLSAQQTITLAAHESKEVELDLVIKNPHRWNGRADPFLYTLSASVSPNLTTAQASAADAVRVPFGVRTFAIDPVKGFLLNGKPYDLHGVNRHQDRQGKGWAISDDDHREDMAILKEMGCTAIRLAHYQHSQTFYDLCDKEGIIAWAEIPVVNRLGDTNSPFTENAKQQYTELIRQNYNHPCIAFWSAGNEVDADGGNFNRNGPPVYDWFRPMRDLEHKEDPTRPAVAAWRERFFPPADVTDYFGLNEYLGWYTADSAHTKSGWEGLEAYITAHSKNGVAGKWAVTEYGAGASMYFHSETPQRMDHSEEYQALLHENTWKVLKQHPEIWGKFLWAGFDFAADDRFEGDHAGINDKGLVTYDRKIKKDAFYFYKASWSQEPVVHLTATRFAVRGLEKIPVKVYSNQPKVRLTVNGIDQGEKSPDNATALWENVPLKPGPNTVTATTSINGKELTDSATWTYTPGAPAEVYVAQDEAMKIGLKSASPRVNFPPKPR